MFIQKSIFIGILALVLLGCESPVYVVEENPSGILAYTDSVRTIANSTGKLSSLKIKPNRIDDFIVICCNIKPDWEGFPEIFEYWITINGDTIEQDTIAYSTCGGGSVDLSYIYIQKIFKPSSHQIKSGFTVDIYGHSSGCITESTVSRYYVAIMTHLSTIIYTN